jgi:hypothetical protein
VKQFKRIEFVMVIGLLMTIPLCRRIERNQFVAAEACNLFGEGKKIWVQQQACFHDEPIFRCRIGPQAKIDVTAEALKPVCQAGLMARLQATPRGCGLCGKKMGEDIRGGFCIAIDQYDEVKERVIRISCLQLPGCCYQITSDSLDNGLCGFFDAFFRGPAVMENAHFPTVPRNCLYFAVRPWRPVIGQTEIGKFGKTLVRIFDGIDAQPMRAPKLRDMALVSGILSHAVNKGSAKGSICGKVEGG